MCWKKKRLHGNVQFTPASPQSWTLKRSQSWGHWRKTREKMTSTSRLKTVKNSHPRWKTTLAARELSTSARSLRNMLLKTRSQACFSLSVPKQWAAPSWTKTDLHDYFPIIRVANPSDQPKMPMVQTKLPVRDQTVRLEFKNVQTLLRNWKSRLSFGPTISPCASPFLNGASNISHRRC